MKILINLIKWFIIGLTTLVGIPSILIIIGYVMAQYFNICITVEAVDPISYYFGNGVYTVTIIAFTIMVGYGVSVMFKSKKEDY